MQMNQNCYENQLQNLENNHEEWQRNFLIETNLVSELAGNLECLRQEYESMWKNNIQSQCQTEFQNEAELFQSKMQHLQNELDEAELRRNEALKCTVETERKIELMRTLEDFLTQQNKSYFPNPTALPKRVLRLEKHDLYYKVSFLIHIQSTYLVGSLVICQIGLFIMLI